MTQPRNTLRILACFGLVALLHLTGAAAHAQTGTAALVGDVVDSQKQVIPGATVTLTSVATSASQVTTVTDDRGAFRFTNMPPGRYQLKVELQGFKTSRLPTPIAPQVDSTTARPP